MKCPSCGIECTAQKRDEVLVCGSCDYNLTSIVAAQMQRAYEWMRQPPPSDGTYIRADFLRVLGQYLWIQTEE